MNIVQVYQLDVATSQEVLDVATSQEVVDTFTIRSHPFVRAIT